MTEQEYLEIAAACDRVLRSPGATLARLAIPLLHVINEHPSSLAPYAPLLTGRRPNGAWDFPRAVFRAGRGLGRALITQEPMSRTGTPVDVVIVSHLSNPRQLTAERDLYFDSLQRLLHERSASSLLVLIDHSAGNAARAARSSIPAARMLLPRNVRPVEEIGIWRSCFAASRQLAGLAAAGGNPLDRKVAFLASRAALSAWAAVNLRMHANLKRIFLQANPRMVVTTYEGDASERLIWHAARAAERRPLCVGYQHARMLRHAHSIRRRIAVSGIDCDPDVLLTSGEVSHAALAASPGLNSTRLIAYGSHRRGQPGMPPAQRIGARRCLVLPDASEAECVALFEFALACARRRPDLHFTLRPHPGTDITGFEPRHRTLSQLPANVSLSMDGPLEGEFREAQYCLYRGSSAVIPAVVAGLKPFYLSRKGELPFDPLFALTEWREAVATPEELTERMSSGAPSQQDLAAAGRAQSVCERYVWPLRVSALDELLSLAPP